MADLKKIMDLFIKSNAKDVEKDIESIDKASGKASKGVNGISKAVKGVGVAFKALGIGLIISAIAGLTEAFSRNERITNAISKVLTTVGNVFSQVTDAIVATYDAITSASENFDGLGKVIKGLLTLAITPLKLSFYAIKLGLQQAQLAWEESFFGNKDPETIKKLNKRIKETKDNINEVTLTAVIAGKSVVDNFSDAVGEVANIGKTAIKELSKVSIKTAYEQADAYETAKNNAIEAAAQQNLLVERYDRQAEQLRQIRDEERNSISERKKANDDLLITLAEQEKAMLKQADLQIQAARLERDRNNNAETRAALIEALANKEGILAQVEGFRSEQKMNDLALDKESIELQNSKAEAEFKIANERKKFNAEQIEDAVLRLETLKQIYEEEAQIEAERLKAVVDNAMIGTQAKIDAQIALDEFEEENRQNKIEIDAALEQARLDVKAENVEKELELDNKLRNSKLESLNTLVNIAGEESKIGKAALLAKQAIALQELLIDLGAIKSKATAVVAGASMDGAKSSASVATGFAETLKLGFPAAIPALIGYAGAAAGIIGSVKSAVSGAKNVAGKFGGSGGGGGNITAPSAPAAASAKSPSFNVVGGSETSQLAQTVAESNKKPTQTYVVSSEVQNANELERKRVASAGF